MRRNKGCMLVAAAAVLAACDASRPVEPESTAARWGAQPNAPVTGEARVVRGFELAPVPLDLAGKNPALVGLGSYLTHVHACWGCHTAPEFAPGGNPFLGQPQQANVDVYMAGGRAFGPFVSRNLTPQADGLPAGLTLAEFVLVMRTGIDLKDEHPHISPLLQVMPWPYTRHMTDQELRAIYEYLRAIPCLVQADENPDRCGGLS